MPSFCSQKLLQLNYTSDSSLTGEHKECIVDLISLLFCSIQSFTCIAILVWLRLRLIKCDGSEKEKILYLFNEHTSRWILTFCLILVTLFESAEGLVSLSLIWAPQNNLNLIITPLISLLSSVSSAVYFHHAERNRVFKMLLLLLVFWPCMVIVRISKLVVLYENEYSIQHLKLQLTWSGVILYSLLSGMEVTVLLQEKYVWSSHESSTKPSDVRDIKYRKKFATLLSRATFFWLVPVLRLGYQKPLELEDLGKLPEDESVEYRFERFNEVYLDEKNACESKMKKISLWRCYLRTFWPRLILGAVIKISGDLVGLIGPLSISVILAYVENVQKGNSLGDGKFITTWEFLQNGFVMAFISLGATFLQSTFSNNFNHLAIMEGVHLRSALQGLVYQKTLHMSVADMDTGAVVNHMSVDPFNMMMLFSMGHYIWAVPFKIILLLVLLYLHLGYSALIGAATIYVLAPLQYKISAKMSKLQKIALDVSDERLKRTSELIQGIKLLKLYGWEMTYGKLIESVREKELKLLLKDAIYVAINTFLTQASSIIVTLVTFGIYHEIEGRNLTPADVFTGLALFNQLTVPLFIIPFVIPIVINSVVSTKRLEDFLNLPEVESNVPWREADVPATVEFKPDSGSVLLHIYDRDVERLSNPFIFDEADGVFISDIHATHALQNSPEGHVTVSIQDGSFSWNPELRTSVLREINIQIPSGKLTVIVGSVGTGKTSLLCAMLGELTVSKGRVKWSSFASGVAYVPQKPWLLNATLKENILFGQPYDGRRFYQVIQACALQPDIDLLPAKDMTEIGERGVNLSGGQRQRIALARAFYSQSRTLLLDDSLSALDAHVANHVYEHGIKMFLLRRNRTVIMVTSKVEHIQQAQKVIVLDNQHIKYQGTYSEIEKLDPELILYWKKSISASEQAAKQTARERHKLERMFSRQALFRPTSTTDVRRKGHLVSFGRQMSHDPSSPLPCQDCDETDHAFNYSIASSSYNPVSPRVSQGISSESLQTRSSSSSGVFMRHPWRRPPSRHNSRISGHASDMIEEENEDLEDNNEENAALQGDKSFGKLMSEEDRERGKISRKVYFGYMRACTLPLSLAVIGLIVITQSLKVASDFWLSDWSSQETTSNATASNISIMQHYVVGYAAFSLAGIILALVTNLTAQLTTLKAVRFLHSEMLQNIIRCPMKFFDTTPLGRIINRFSSDVNVIDKKLPVTLPVLLRFVMLCLSAIIVDIIVTPYFLLIVIFIMAVYYFIQYFFRYSSRELQRLDSITKSPIFSHFSETLSGLPTIRAFHQEKRFTEKLNTCINTNNLAFIMANSSNCWLGVALDYLGGIILFFATISAMLAAIYGQVSPAFVGISMTYTLLVPIYLNWVVRNLASVEMYMNSVERVQAYCKLPVENYLGTSQEVIPKDWPSAGKISFENVTLRYDTAQTPVLRNITLEIKSGEKVGICGRTGTGKSSLVMSLFRMILIAEGKIYIDGIDIMTLPVALLRSHISIIPQDTVLFSGTVRENLDPGRQHTDAELWSVLETAQLKDVVMSHEKGLECEVLEEGSNFSVGQNQLFCLARALLRRSHILVMDEATASLDTHTDSVLQNVVASFCQHCTVLTIAHRVSSIMEYDRVLVLDGGHIVEDGAPTKLMEQKTSLFAQLLKASE